MLYFHSPGRKYCIPRAAFLFPVGTHVMKFPFPGATKLHMRNLTLKQIWELLQGLVIWLWYRRAFTSTRTQDVSLVWFGLVDHIFRDDRFEFTD
jgi:hypothetical protein